MEIAVISGKGGTGKSCVSAVFATIDSNIVLADCDVDAANMYIIFNPIHEDEEVYISGQKAVIDYSLCSNCQICMSHCRFDAISLLNNRITISDILCDGCHLCSRICPNKAISMVDENRSRMYSGSYRKGKMVYGRLAPGEENSGKLVHLVREKAKKIAQKENVNIIIDGPPGISCPVISAITGVDHVVIVTEPSLSGLHDLKRAIEICNKFNLKIWVIINKYDLNIKMTNQIQAYCQTNNILVIAKLLFDTQVVEAMLNCKSMLEFAPDSNFTRELVKSYHLILNL